MIPGAAAHATPPHTTGLDRGGNVGGHDTRRARDHRARSSVDAARVPARAGQLGRSRARTRADRSAPGIRRRLAARPTGSVWSGLVLLWLIFGFATVVAIATIAAVTQ